MSNTNNIEFRVMPNGDGRWYWEVLKDGRDVVLRGLADSEPDACKDAGTAAREAKLIPPEAG
jgi:hypothetical protein